MSRRPVRRVRRKPKNRFRPYYITAALLLLLGLAAYKYRDGLAYYFSFKTHKTGYKNAKDKRINDIRNHQVLTDHKGKMVGIDVSEYQGIINWKKVKTVETTFPLTYVFVRATAGNDRPDTYFKQNWAGAKKAGLFRGAYHYYRPNENSLEQAELFIKTVRIRKGDLPPVLDIEKLPRNQPMDSLKKGLKRWLNKIEQHYGMKPIIYTGEKYYNQFLDGEFDEYPFWIANYNFFVEKIDDDWLFWQFTEKATIEGINGTVDVNIFNGNMRELMLMTAGR